jgi:ketosteroid isomerase-like protein
MSQESVELAHRLFEAFNRRDLDALLAFMDDDVEAVPILVAMEGGYRGHDGIRRWWGDLLDAFPDFTIEVLEVRARGDLTLAIVRIAPAARVATSRSSRRSGLPPSSVTRRSSGGAPTQLKPKPSKPWGCGSRRCRRRTWRSCANAAGSQSK